MTAPIIEAESFRSLGYRAVDLMTDYLASIRDHLVYQPMAQGERAALMDASLTKSGVEPTAILDRFITEILPHAMGNGHPRFFGWANSPPAPIGVIADFLAAGMNPSCAGGDHAAIYVERAVVRWLMELIGFPTVGSMGILVSGGSMASLTGLTAARTWAARSDGWDVRSEGLQGNHPQFVMYLTGEAHTTLHKAIELLGLGTRSLRVIAVDKDFRIDLNALSEAIAEDKLAGRRPFCVAASAGTVSTGAVDPLNDLADICDSEGMWLHVDGALGAIGLLDPTKADQYRGIERADSVAIDPHKWLQVPVECGCAMIRDGALLRDTFSLVPPYVRTEEGKGIGGLPWYSEYGFQQSRGFRALKLWMTLQHLGREGIAEMVIRHNRQAAYLANLIRAEPELELINEPNLSIVCFRYRPSGHGRSLEQLNGLNKAIMEAVQAGGDAFVTQAMLNGAFALRANVMHYATTNDDLAALVGIVLRAGRRIAAESEH